MGLAIFVDASTLKTKRALPVPRYWSRHGGQFKYLVKSPEELFMVDKYYVVENEMFGDVGVDSEEDGGD